ncbi:MAG: excisionase family DNA-binding protein [Candidatus Binataceae bacterium]
MATAKNSRQRAELARRAFAVREIAASLGVSEGFVRLEIGRGLLPTIRAGRRVLIPAAGLESYLAARAS